MKSKYLKIIKKLHNNSLNKNVLVEFYEDPKDIDIIRELLNNGILNQNSYKIGHNIKSLKTVITKHDKQSPIFTPQGEKYYFDHIHKSWYRRIKERWLIELIIDIFAIIGFFTSIYLAYIKIFKNSE